LVEIERGQITVDGGDIGAVDLQELRSRISIIPQEPVLFSGNIRFNLDPFNPSTMELERFLKERECRHLLSILRRMGIDTVDALRTADLDNDCHLDIRSLQDYLKSFDEELIDALRLSHCLDLLQRNANREDEVQSVLDIKVEENGSNFSVGERQLICLSRAIIRKSPILLLDEATSSVDQETDKLIQGTIRSVFKSQTILTIAHRIDTILDYDKILIMDQGRKMEFDAPSVLLNDEKSQFTQIVQESFGINASNVHSFLKDHGTTGVIEPVKDISTTTV